MGKFWLILSRYLPWLVWCMSQNSILTVSWPDLYTHTWAIHSHTKSRDGTCIHTQRHTHTHPWTEGRCFCSSEWSQRLLSLRSGVEYHNKLHLDLRGLHPQTLRTLDPACVCVCVFQPYLLMEASKALESLYIFNAVKLSFSPCCLLFSGKRKSGWIKHKCNKCMCWHSRKKKHDCPTWEGVLLT